MLTATLLKQTREGAPQATLGTGRACEQGARDSGGLPAGGRLLEATKLSADLTGRLSAAPGRGRAAARCAAGEVGRTFSFAPDRVGCGSEETAHPSRLACAAAQRANSTPTKFAVRRPQSRTCHPVCLLSPGRPLTRDLRTRSCVLSPLLQHEVFGC